MNVEHILSLVREYGVHFAETAMHEAASKVNISKTAALGKLNEIRAALEAPQEPAPASQAEEVLEWSGAVPFVTMVQSLVAPDADPWGDEFLAWYEPERWFGEHRACAIWLGEKMKAQAAPASQAGVREALLAKLDKLRGPFLGDGFVTIHRDEIRAALSHPTQAQEKDAARWRSRLWELIDDYKFERTHPPQSARDRLKHHIDSAIAASTAKEKT
jgi:hypothetical protein